MSYEKHTWETGETITAEKLNNLENGIEDAGSSGSGSGVLVVNFVEDSAEDYIEPEDPLTTVTEQWHLNKTFKEIYDALSTSCPVIFFQATTDVDGNDARLSFSDVTASICDSGSHSGTWKYRIWISTLMFRASDMNGYPIYQIASGGK